ncbi:hypothetical protein EDB84DRAFT_1434385 [Lactarius hengduanensis]|nr:hypothetical protein EDB84DRAFT_1434385 [Lactarius hengduanensis]
MSPTDIGPVKHPKVVSVAADPGLSTPVPPMIGGRLQAPVGPICQYNARPTKAVDEISRVPELPKQYPDRQSCRQADKSHSSKHIHHITKRDPFLPMAPKGIKASKVFQRKSKAKIIDWVSRKGSRGTRNIPVEVSTSTNLPIPRKDAGGREIDNHEAILHETDPPSMDVDKTFWIEEPVIPEPKRSQRTYMEEFIPRIGPYLRCLLNSEGVPAMTMCQSCMSAPFEWRWTATMKTTSGSQNGYDAAADLGFGNSKPGHRDKEDNPIITVVDRSGIHEIGVSWCCCPKAPERDMQLMMAGLFQLHFATQRQRLPSGPISGAAEGLPTMESPHFPKRFGFGYGEDEEQKPGSMAIFCALCAQPGINLPDDWREYENSDILFMRGFMMDGNFQAEHMKMRNPENDIPLSEGTGFMQQLRGGRGKLTLTEIDMHDHHAVNNVNKHGSHLESTGIGATACIHGAFVPDAVVDFQREKPRYSPSFIKGGRQIDGETIETLWAPLNEITRSTRGMSTSHRREVIDDHMNDSNWKKLIDLGKFLPMDAASAWGAEEEHAQRSEVAMSKEGNRSSGHKGHATWLGSGLKIQEMQLSLQALVRKIRSHPTPDQQRDIALKRARLQERVDAFQKQAANILQASPTRKISASNLMALVKEMTMMSALRLPKKMMNCKYQEITLLMAALMQYIPLHLPSHLGRDWCRENDAEDLAKAELRLREGQLNDTLHHIRISLGHKSYLYRHDVRPARTQRLKTRAWAEVHTAESTVQHHARVYTRARQAMVDLGVGSTLLDRYKVLRRQDLSVKTSVIAPHVRGQRNKLLPWFWTMDVRRDADIGEWMEDFYRVHWLRAKAQKMRWIEELQCLQVEMESAVRFFRHQEQFWQEKQELIDPQSQPGHAVWAARQSAMWGSMAIQAGSKFSALLKSDPPPEFAKVLLRPQTISRGLKQPHLLNPHVHDAGLAIIIYRQPPMRVSEASNGIPANDLVWAYSPCLWVCMGPSLNVFDGALMLAHKTHCIGTKLLGELPSETFIVGNPRVTRPLPAPTPTKNPTRAHGYGFPQLRVWVPAGRAGTETRAGWPCSSSASDPSSIRQLCAGFGGVKCCKVSRTPPRDASCHICVRGDHWCVDVEGLTPRTSAARGRKRKRGRLIAGGRKQSCRYGRLGREGVGFESLRPHTNAACWGVVVSMSEIGCDEVAACVALMSKIGKSAGPRHVLNLFDCVTLGITSGSSKSSLPLSSPGLPGTRVGSSSSGSKLSPPPAASRSAFIVLISDLSEAHPFYSPLLKPDSFPTTAATSAKCHAVQKRAQLFLTTYDQLTPFPFPTTPHSCSVKKPAKPTQWVRVWHGYRVTNPYPYPV